MDLLPIVETTTTVVTFLLMASGIPACMAMYRNKSTKNVPYPFFLVSTMNSAFALYYGMLVSNSTLILINGVGVLLWGFYVLSYIGVSKSKSWPLSQLLMLGVLLFGHVVYMRLFTPFPPALTDTMGLFLFVWSVILLLTPIFDIMDIVKQGSSEGADLSLLAGGTLCCFAWLAYGYLLNDFYVYGPNIIGLAVSFAKMFAISAYRPKTKTQ